LGRQRHQWGYAASPILHRDLCIVHFGPGERSFLFGLDKRTGRTVWQRELPHLGADASWEEVGGRTPDATATGGGHVAEAAGSWATPLVVRSGSREELILPCPLRVLAVAPRTGRSLWTCDGPNIGIYSSPCFGEGLVGLSADGFTNIVMAVRPGGSGEATATHRLWCRKTPDSRACVGSPVIHRGLLFQMTYMGMAQCLELQTGQTVWEERLTGSGARNASWSSPVLAAGRLYFANQNADVFVVRAAPQFACLATNSIGGERMNASPAMSAGAIYLRTYEHLWCMAETKAR
jgi:outer membrane protein assembly factor BamB